MTGRERMACAMRLAEPDRVPVMCQLALGHYFLHTGLDAIEIWHSSQVFAEALLMLQRRYGFDGILVNLPGRDPAWRRHVRRIETRDDETVITWNNGWTTVAPPDDNPHVYRENGERFVARFGDVDPEQLFYVEPHDLAGLTYPTAFRFGGPAEHGPRFFPPWHFDTIRAVIARTGGEVSVHGEVFSPFSQFLELLGYTEGLLALRDDPGKVQACLAALTAGTIALGCGLAAAGADAILISSAFAGAGFISPGHYREFVLPCESAVIRGIRAHHDLPVYTHTCGAIGDRLDLMLASGTSGIDTLDPPPLGTVELAAARAVTRGRAFLKGNLDAVNTLLQGTREQVAAAARQRIAVAAPGGGYILSSACSVAPHTPPENIAVLREVAEEFGRYPIAAAAAAGG